MRNHSGVTTAPSVSYSGSTVHISGGAVLNLVGTIEKTLSDLYIFQKLAFFEAILIIICQNWDKFQLSSYVPTGLIAVQCSH